MEISEELDVGSGDVQGDDSDVDGSWLGRNVHDPEIRWSSSPGVAENRLSVTVEICQMRGGWAGSEKECAFVETSLNVLATSKAGLVASGDQNPPFFGSFARRLYTRADGILP